MSRRETDEAETLHIEVMEHHILGDKCIGRLFFDFLRHGLPYVLGSVAFLLIVQAFGLVPVERS